jgi:hypothetical protein
MYDLYVSIITLVILIFLFYTNSPWIYYVLVIGFAVIAFGLIIYNSDTIATIFNGSTKTLPVGGVDKKVVEFNIKVDKIKETLPPVIDEENKQKLVESVKKVTEVALKEIKQPKGTNNEIAKLTPTIANIKTDDTTRMAFSLALKTAITTGLTIGSLGIPAAETLADLIFAVLDIAKLSTAMDKLRNTRFVNELSNIKFGSAGFHGLEESVDKYLLEMKTNDPNNYNNNIANICGVYNSITTDIAAVMGDVIALVVPDDFGLARIIITALIKEMTNNSYNSLKSLVLKLPTASLKVLFDEYKLSTAITEVVFSVLPKRDDTFWKSAKRTGILGAIMPFTIMIPIVNIIVPIMFYANVANTLGIDFGLMVAISEKYVMHNIEPAAKLLASMVPMIFVITYILSKTCKAPALLEKARKTEGELVVTSVQ